MLGEKFTEARLSLPQALADCFLGFYEFSLMLHDLRVDLVSVLQPDLVLPSDNLKLLFVVFSLLGEDLSLNFEALLRHISDGLRLNSATTFVLLDHITKGVLEVLEHPSLNSVSYEPDCALALLLVVLVANGSDARIHICRLE